MTSTSIYTPITPTYLYIKQHSITGLKYFGKTTRNPYTYNGSGKHWIRHINKHGKEHIKTLWVSEPYTDTSIVEVALKFSADNDIVKSKEWANIDPENGLDGSPSGAKRSDETKAKQSALRKGTHPTKETRSKLSIAKSGKNNPMYGRKGKQKQITCPHCGKTGGVSTMKQWHFDKCQLNGCPPTKRSKCSQETKDKISVTMTGKKRGPYKKHKPHKPHKHRGIKGKPQPQITCPHCGKTGGESNMKRYHFDKCKKADN